MGRVPVRLATLTGMRSALGRLLSFPNPVNEKAARVVAGGVVVLCLAVLVTQWYWLLLVLAYGFLARLVTGPSLSPLGQLATRVVAPRLGGSKPVPGPPKRFAQGIGATLSVAAVVVYFGFGLAVPALVLVAAIAVAATLESVFAFCLGCAMFAYLMRLGVIPASTCEACENIALRRA